MYDPARDDRRLLAIVDGALAEAARRGGAHLVCGPGCTRCCMGPFPINALDAWRLRRGLLELERRDSARAQAVRKRARTAAALMMPDFPGDPDTGFFDEGDEAGEEEFCTLHAAVPCPALHPGSGTCDLYAHRPLSCRTYGPPVSLGGEPMEPCSLCFKDARENTIEACRMEIDPGGVEDEALCRLEECGAPRLQTTVAFVLARK